MFNTQIHRLVNNQFEFFFTKSFNLFSIFVLNYEMQISSVKMTCLINTAYMMYKYNLYHMKITKK